MAGTIIGPGGIYMVLSSSISIVFPSISNVVERQEKNGSILVDASTIQLKGLANDKHRHELSWRTGASSP